MEPQKRKISDLRKLPNNPRVIKDQAFKTLCKSIQDNPDYFEARPCILSDRTGELIIIAGNQRFEAAKFLKLKEIPTHLISGLTEEREKEIIIRDNVANGEWDMDLLANEWNEADLKEWGVNTVWSGLDVNNMTDDDINIDEEFDPIGSSTDLHKVIFIFDNELEAETFMSLHHKEQQYKKFGGGSGKIWQVNLSTTYGQK